MRKSILQQIILLTIIAILFYIIIPNNSLSSSTAYFLGILTGGIAQLIYIHYQKYKSSKIKTLYIGNLSYKANVKTVTELFSKYGKVTSVSILKDKQTGKKRGFGFILMQEKDAKTAMEELDGTEYFGRTLKVRLSKEQNRTYKKVN